MDNVPTSAAVVVASVILLFIAFAAGRAFWSALLRNAASRASAIGMTINWSTLKAMVAGFFAPLLLGLMLAPIAMPFWFSICMNSYTLTAFLDNGLSSLVPWLMLAIVAAGAAFGGYVAASRVATHRVRVGVYLGLTAAAFNTASVLLCNVEDPAAWMYLGYSVVLWLVFAPLGARAIATRWPRETPVRILRAAWILSGYAGPSLGALVAASVALVFAFYPPAELVAQGHDCEPLPVGRLRAIAGIGVLAAAYGLFVFVRTRGWRRGLWRNAFLYALVLAIGAYALGFARRDRTNRALYYAESEAARARADEDYVYPDDSNAATLYIQAANLIDPDGGAVGDDGLYGLLADSPEQLADWVSRNEEARTLARAARQRQFVRFPSRYQAAEWDWSFRNQMKLDRLLIARGLVLARDGHVAEGLDHMQAVLHALDGWRRDMPLHFIMRNAAVDRIRRALLLVLRMPDPSGEEVAVAQDMLERAQDALAMSPADWEKLYVQEVRRGIDETVFYETRRDGALTYFLSQFVPKDIVVKKALATAHKVLAEESRRAMDALITQETYTAWELVDLRGLSLRRRLRWAFTGSIAGRVEGLARWHLGDFDVMVHKHIYRDQRVRMAKALCAVRRFQTAEGRLPSSWDDFVPAYLPSVPEDPENGQPLRLLNKGDHVLLYSVGTDGEDDRGEGITPCRDDDEGFCWSEGDDTILPWPPGRVDILADRP